MRFVVVKSENKQVPAMILWTRDVQGGQRTQLINSIRVHLAEYRVLAPQGPLHIEKLIAQIEHPASALPHLARTCLAELVDPLRYLQQQTAALNAEIAARAAADDVTRRLMTVPGTGALFATAIEALAPPPETFRSCAGLCFWTGITHVQRSTGGIERLGRTSRMASGRSTYP